MAGRGETVKYIIDADTSGFTRGMAEAALQAGIVGRKIDRSLSTVSRTSQNNFRDISRNAQDAASNIRNFGVAFQAFNTTSVVIGVTALAGAFIELAGALTAAGSTLAVIAPILTQVTASSFAMKAGVFGLSDAFAAIGKNDGKAFQEALAKLGPEATKVAYAVGGLNQAMNSIRLNTQQALLQGIGDALLQLGARTLPIVNLGFQTIGQSMNRAFKQAATLAGSPVFSGLLAKIFSDTARTIDTLSAAILPLFTIFTNLYMITAPYVQLLAEWLVGISEAGAAYLSSTEGATAFNLAVAQGVIALQQLGSFIGSIFGFLVAIFRTSIASGVSLISTITGIVNQMTAWVNSAKGQAQLAALFQFTALTIQAVATAIGQVLGFFFTILQVISSLSPEVQNLMIGFLATSLVLRPLITYVGQLFLALRVLGSMIFNIMQQAVLVAASLGAFASIALVLATGLVILSQIIGGPLGSALLIVGLAIASYVALSYLMTLASNYAAGAMLRQGYAAMYTAQAEAVLAGMNGIVAGTMLQMAGAASAAGAGMTFAARAAMLLQAALVPLLVLAAGVLILLSMLGLFSGRAKSAQGASIGLGSSLSGLQKSLKGVGASGGKAAGGSGLGALNNALGDVGSAAEEAQKGLAGFDKMTVLTDKTAGGASGLPAMPALPSVPDLGGAGGGGGIGMPTIDTADFDKAIEDMMGQFGDLQSKIDEGFTNPFAPIGKFIKDNPLPFFIAFAAIVGVIIALFATGAVTIGFATLPLTLIVIAIVAIIAMIILLVQNWDTVWATIQSIVAGFAEWFKGVWSNVMDFLAGVLKTIGEFFVALWSGIVTVFSVTVEFFRGIFKGAWDAIVAIWSVVVEFFQAIFDAIGTAIGLAVKGYVLYFKLAWEGIKVIWSVVVTFFQGVWNGIGAIFGGAVGWFGNIFNGAWNAIKNAFGAVGGFFQGVWNSIVGIFGSVGTAIGNAIGGSFRSVVNTVINAVSGIINNVIDLINGAINLINKLPGVRIGNIGRLSLPRMAKGGVVTSSTFAEIGEDGAEAVMPLENNTQWIDKLADRINSANGRGDGQPINLTVQIGEDKVATKIIELINEKTQMSGRNSIIV